MARGDGITEKLILGCANESLAPLPPNQKRARRPRQPAGVRVLAETGWLPSTVMLPSAAIVTA